MHKRKFKKGDILILINNDEMSAPCGSTALCIRYTRKYVYVKWIDKGNTAQINGGYYHDDFAKANTLLESLYK